MADQESRSLRASYGDFQDELVLARSIAEAFGNLAAEIPVGSPPLSNPHSWVFVIERMVDRLQVASDTFERALHAHLSSIDQSA